MSLFFGIHQILKKMVIFPRYSSIYNILKENGIFLHHSHFNFCHKTIFNNKTTSYKLHTISAKHSETSCKIQISFAFELKFNQSRMLSTRAELPCKTKTTTKWSRIEEKLFFASVWRIPLYGRLMNYRKQATTADDSIAP